LKAWKGDSANVSQAQHVFRGRARLNGAAQLGQYSNSMETAA